MRVVCILHQVAPLAWIAATLAASVIDDRRRRRRRARSRRAGRRSVSPLSPRSARSGLASARRPSSDGHEDEGGCRQAVLIGDRVGDELRSSVSGDAHRAVRETRSPLRRRPSTSSASIVPSGSSSFSSTSRSAVAASFTSAGCTRSSRAIGRLQRHVLVDRDCSTARRGRRRAGRGSCTERVSTGSSGAVHDDAVALDLGLSRRPRAPRGRRSHERRSGRRRGRSRSPSTGTATSRPGRTTTDPSPRTAPGSTARRGDADRIGRGRLRPRRSRTR